MTIEQLLVLSVGANLVMLVIVGHLHRVALDRLQQIHYYDKILKSLRENNADAHQ